MKKVLIVEDEKDITKILTARLEQNGFEVISAPDGINAVREVHEKKPDLVILDIMLPGGGINALKNIRSSERVKNTPVVVLTGMQDNAKKSEIDQIGVQGYVTKPYEFPALLAVINNILEPHAK